MQAEIAIQGIELQQQKLIELKQQKEQLEKKQEGLTESILTDNQSGAYDKRIIDQRNKILNSPKTSSSFTLSSSSVIV